MSHNTQFSKIAKPPKRRFKSVPPQEDLPNERLAIFEHPKISSAEKKGRQIPYNQEFELIIQDLQKQNNPLIKIKYRDRLNKTLAQERQPKAITIQQLKSQLDIRDRHLESLNARIILLKDTVKPTESTRDTDFTEYQELIQILQTNNQKLQRKLEESTQKLSETMHQHAKFQKTYNRVQQDQEDLKQEKASQLKALKQLSKTIIQERDLLEQVQSALQDIEKTKVCEFYEIIQDLRIMQVALYDIIMQYEFVSSSEEYMISEKKYLRKQYKQKKARCKRLIKQFEKMIIQSQDIQKDTQHLHYSHKDTDNRFKADCHKLSNLQKTLFHKDSIILQKTFEIEQQEKVLFNQKGEIAVFTEKLTQGSQADDRIIQYQLNAADREIDILKEQLKNQQKLLHENRYEIYQNLKKREIPMENDITIRLFPIIENSLMDLSLQEGESVFLTQGSGKNMNQYNYGILEKLKSELHSY